MQKFNIGDKVWVARNEGEYEYMTCPDCQGQLALKIIMGDGTEHALDCDRCTERGWAGTPSGRVKFYVQKISAKQMFIDGMEIKSGTPTVYKMNFAGNSWYTYEEDSVFATEQEALARAKQLKDDADALELKRASTKTKDGKTWAWHVRYYRDNLKRAIKDVERYSRNLDVAKIKAKEPQE